MVAPTRREPHVRKQVFRELDEEFRRTASARTALDDRLEAGRGSQPRTAGTALDRGAELGAERGHDLFEGRAGAHRCRCAFKTLGGGLGRPPYDIGLLGGSYAINLQPPRSRLLLRSPRPAPPR